MMKNTYRQIDECRAMIRRIGAWAGARWMRNQGISFEHAYYIMFNRYPRVL